MGRGIACYKNHPSLVFVLIKTEETLRPLFLHKFGENVNENFLKIIIFEIILKMKPRTPFEISSLNRKKWVKKVFYRLQKLLGISCDSLVRGFTFKFETNTWVENDCMASPQKRIQKSIWRTLYFQKIRKIESNHFLKICL